MIVSWDEPPLQNSCARLDNVWTQIVKECSSVEAHTNANKKGYGGIIFE
jgi:hypothetical protein